MLDTNVVISANLREQGLQSRVLAFALSKHARLFVTEPILDEYERVLGYPRLKFDPKQVRAFLNRTRRSAIIVRPDVSIAECKDESDNRFLECAETARADFLVTGNLRHFPAKWKGTRIVNGREFIDIIMSR